MAKAKECRVRVSEEFTYTINSTLKRTLPAGWVGTVSASVAARIKKEKKGEVLSDPAPSKAEKNDDVEVDPAAAKAGEPSEDQKPAQPAGGTSGQHEATQN